MTYESLLIERCEISAQEIVTRSVEAVVVHLRQNNDVSSHSTKDLSLDN